MNPPAPTAVLHVYLQSLDQLFTVGDVGNVDGRAERVQHLHFMQDVSAAGGTDDQQLPALMENQIFIFISTQTDTHIHLCQVY